ncbi:MAG: alpha-E domain-containing protein [Acidobacteriota bacterium]
MLSRVADSLYWMSRYLERAEHAARLLDVNLNLMLDESSISSDHRWLRMLHALGNPSRLKWSGNAYELARNLTFDTSNKSSIVSCIIAARENARQVREQISTEQWQKLNSLYIEVTSPQVKRAMRTDAAADFGGGPTAFLQAAMEAVHQFQGVTDSTMSHGEGWQFIQAGRYLERATATGLLLEAYSEDVWGNPDCVPEGNEYLDWTGLLRCATAFEAYCKVYTADLTSERILEFLLLDAEFPHSLRFSIDSLKHSLQAIQERSGKTRAEELNRISGRLSASLGFASVDEILTGDLVAYLQSIQRQCQAIHETIYRLYVDYPIQTALAG